MSWQKNKKIMVVVVMTVIFVSMLIAIGMLWGWQDTPPPPAPKPLPKTQINKAPVSSKEHFESAEDELKTVYANGTTPIQSSVNLEQMTELRAELDKTKLQVAILQEKEKLQPKMIVQQPAQKPSLTPEVARPQTYPSVSVISHRPVVLSIQSVDSHATAIIRSSKGDVVTVRPGDRFEGGVVSIKREGVVIKNGTKSTMLSFE